ncbi:UNVERIFIED_CONTAM: hypothetical protein FKN15_077954 [Acipenser sinensis]
MVFESVVVDVLNRFLGDYVVNLDSSQLKLGIWGGDAVLRNLDIKENALSQLDIPFKVRSGHIEKLELKIPWKNLYNESVEATLAGVYLLIVPTAKKPKEKQDTFVEKLVTQVIKNLQVKISNIHIRYEDDLVQLDNLFAYWNVNSKLYSNDSSKEALFEAMKLSFQLLSMSFSIKEDYGKPEIIKVSIIDLSTMLTQRPGAQAIKLSTKISTFEVSGLLQNLSTPILLTSRSAEVENKNPLLSLLFETNPLDGSADQRLRVEAQPLEIVYDAVTVNSLSEFFMPPQDMQLEELTSATLMKLEEFRDRTSTGLMYVIETQKILDLKINLMASYIIVPQTGFYTSSENLLVLDLGHLKVTSKSRKGLPQLTVGQSCIEDIMSRAYESFDVELSSLQLLYSKPEQDWKNARKSKQSSLHILEPVDLRVDFSRAMVVSDPRMPKFKIFGELPLLSVRISDEKVKDILALIDSIPLPKGPPAPSASNAQSTPQAPKYPLTMTPQLTPRNQPLPNLRSSVMFESDSKDKPVYIITTQDNSETDLLTLDYIKAEKNGPEFKMLYNNTEQLIKVNFSSLDVHLHIEALLNAMNFLNNLIPPSEKDTSEESAPAVGEEKKEGTTVAKKSSMTIIIIP